MTEALYMDIQMLCTIPDPTPLSDEFDQWFANHKDQEVV